MSSLTPPNEVEFEIRHCDTLTYFWIRTDAADPGLDTLHLHFVHMLSDSEKLVQLPFSLQFGTTQ
jgi:hypothetical protein